MEHNDFSGTIPMEWGGMRRLGTFSIHRNSVTGEMPEDLCPGWYSMYDLKADCEEVYCWCCTDCFVDPATTGTETPTAAPSDDTGTETPTESSTAFSTSDASCESFIRTNKECYVRGAGELITVSYKLCDFQVEDSLLVYAHVPNETTPSSEAVYTTQICDDQNPCVGNGDQIQAMNGEWTLYSDSWRFGEGGTFQIHLSSGGELTQTLTSNLFQISTTCS
jgi:hypothetical protein